MTECIHVAKKQKNKKYYRCAKSGFALKYNLCFTGQFRHLVNVAVDRIWPL